MLNYSYDLDLTPGGVVLFVPIKQYEDNVKITFRLFSRSGNFSFPENVKVEVRGTKEDGHGFSYDDASGVVLFSGRNKEVSLFVTKQMTAVKGKVFCEFVFKDSNDREMITASFAFKVYKAALDQDTILSESDIKEFKDCINNVFVQDGKLFFTRSDGDILGPFDVRSVKVVATS